MKHLRRLGSYGASLSLITWVALGLIAIAAAASAVAVSTSRLDNWMPNLATEALSIAVTILVVQRIVEREARRRVQPRVDHALQVVSSAFASFVHMGAKFDFASTHGMSRSSRSCSARRPSTVTSGSSTT